MGLRHALLIVPVWVACSGGEGEGAGPDAGGVAPDAGSYDHLLGDVYPIGKVVVGFRESGQWNFDLPGTWLVRQTAYLPTGPDSADYTTTLYLDEPGTTGRPVGDVQCVITGSLTVASVVGFDRADRIKAVETIATNDCTGTVGVTDEAILEALSRDPDGNVVFMARWAPLDIADDAPRPAWIWEDGGKAHPYLSCPDPGYCAPQCNWDYLSPPSGPGCVE